MKPLLGFGMFHSSNTIGMVPLTRMPVLLRSALRSTVTGLVVPRNVNRPVALVDTVPVVDDSVITAKVKAALLKDRGARSTLPAAQGKLKSGRLAVRCAEEAVQIHGGYGYIEEYPVCRFYRDAKILTIGEGTDEVQQMVIARALGA